MPRVSVVLPTYNRAELAEEAVASVLAQDFEDFEVLVVDDGSTDDTVARIEARFGRDPRVRCLRKSNGGTASARNLGMREARAAWVALLDSDDLWPTDWLRSQWAAQEAHPEADLIVSDALYVGPWKREGTRLFARPSWRTPDSIDAMLNGAYALPSCWLIRSEVGRRLPFDPTFPMSEDTAFLFAFNERGYRLVENPAVCTHYRHLGASGASEQKVARGNEHLREQVRLLERYAHLATNPKPVRYQIARRMTRLLAREGMHRSLRPHAWRWLRARPFSAKPYRFWLRSLVARDTPLRVLAEQ